MPLHNDMVIVPFAGTWYIVYGPLVLAPTFLVLFVSLTLSGLLRVLQVSKIRSFVLREMVTS